MGRNLELMACRDFMVILDLQCFVRDASDDVYNAELLILNSDSTRLFQKKIRLISAY